MTALTLKFLAVLSMFIDHAGAVLFPGVMWMRYIGRLAFPIYAFFIVEGFVHTRSVKKYLLRLFVFALISEVPFNLAFRGQFFAPDYQNVFFTLFLALLALVLVRQFSGNFFLQALSVACLALTAQELHTDYRYVGVCLVTLLYVYRKRSLPAFVSAILVLVPFLSRIEWFSLLSFIPLKGYNDKRGKFGLKYFFYLFYPLHLMLLVSIRRFLTGSWTY